MPQQPIVIESYFAQLFLDIQDRINTKVPEIEWIEQDFGQDIYDKWRPNVAFPAVLIDFTSADYESIASLSQTGDVTLQLRLMVAPFEQSYEDAPLEVRKDALQYFEIEHKLVKAIHGWAPDYTQPFVRTRIHSNNRNDIGLRVRELQFTTNYQEFEE